MPASEDKRAAQIAFLDADNIKALYQQIQMGGTIITGGENLTQQIAHDILPEIEQTDVQREVGLEPER